MKTAIELIAEERQRQIDAEGYSAEHDDEHTDDDLRWAASCYLLHGHLFIDDTPVAYRFWPWSRDSWKPADEVRNLVKAGALIAGEIDRLQRAERRFQEEDRRSQL